MTNGSNDRIEQMLERSMQLLEDLAQNQRRIIQTQAEVIQIQERQQEQIQALVNAAARHDALIERLDAILERLIYREGRKGEGDPQA